MWIRPTPLNAARAYRALAVFGTPLSDLQEDDLATPGTVFQIGVAPVRIDIVTRIDGVEFDEAWQARIPVSMGGTRTFVLSREHLLRNKKASGRLQDLADVEWLEHNDPEEPGDPQPRS